MKKSTVVKNFVSDIQSILQQPIIDPYEKLFLKEYPFDLQLLNLSSLYRKSRAEYLKLGGVFSPSVVSTMRSLSTHDLFKNEIEYTPAHSEINWLYQNIKNTSDAEEQIKTIGHFHDISIFHEQNHRIVWKLLPPAPIDKDHLRRYLNFAESLVVCLDLALADQVDTKISKICERLNLFYRPAGAASLKNISKAEYRKYLLSAFVATYYCLERIYDEDIFKAVDRILPAHKKWNRSAVRRGLELNEDFTEVTNPQWQEIYWQSASIKLGRIHQGSRKPVLFLPEHPLDLRKELSLVEKIFNYFSI